MATPDPSAADPSTYAEFAQSLADAAGEVTRSYFRTRFSIDEKSDDSPVTIADREAETAMRSRIVASYPAHGILGEEEGAERIDAEWVWVLDPIDGTRCFIAGKPTFVTLIALVRNGVPVLGVIDQPVAGERWVGVGGETRFNGARVTTRACDRLDRAILNTTGPNYFAGDEIPAFAKLSAAAKDTLYGGDGYAYGLVASGFVDLVVEAGLKPYDFCALAPVVEGAGGIMTDWQGRSLTMNSDGRVVAAGDAAAHRLALEALGMMASAEERA